MLILANCTNYLDHTLCKPLPRLPDLLASYSTKPEKITLHLCTGKLLIAMHFILRFFSPTNENIAGVSGFT